MRKIVLLALFLSLALSACGKKGALYYEGERGKPDFDNVIDEEL
jgi:predicted small lipoprotein YifL